MCKCHLLISTRLRNCPCGSFLLLPHIAAVAAFGEKANLPFLPTDVYLHSFIIFFAILAILVIFFSIFSSRFVFIVWSSTTGVSAKACTEKGLKLLLIFTIYQHLGHDLYFQTFICNPLKNFRFSILFEKNFLINLLPSFISGRG